MPREFSENLYWRIIYLHADGLSTVDISNTLYLNKGVVNKIKKRYERWLCVKNPFKGVPGQRKLFSRSDLSILRNLVGEKVDWFLDELVYEMECMTGKRVSISTLWRSLYYLGITRKKVNILHIENFFFFYTNYLNILHVKLQKAALERNEITRAHYLATIGEYYTRNQLVFIDESYKDERSLSRLYGYSLKNIHAQKKVVFIRGKRYTILPALILDGFVAIDVFEGSCDKKRFVDFILDQVVNNNYTRFFFTLFFCTVIDKFIIIFRCQ